MIASQRLHHLQQYHTKGNPVGNGPVPGTMSHPPPPSTASLPTTVHQSTVTAPPDTAAPPRDHISQRVTQEEEDCDVQQQQQQLSQYSRQYVQRRSHVNGDVFYLSGRANTAPAPCTTSADLDDLQVTTTFKYLTYDRDYFRERQKSSALQDCNLRHSSD